MVFDVYFGVPVFALGSRAHLAAQVVHDEMEAVADAQNRHVKFQHARVGDGGVIVVNRRRTTRKNNSQGMQGLDFGEGRCARQYDGEYILFANTPGNELGVLRTEIEDYDCLGVHSLVWQGAGRDVKTGD